MAARTRHDWLLIDTGERFLRPKEARITAVEPFRIVE
jgi:hypothetical protein